MTTFNDFQGTFLYIISLLGSNRLPPKFTSHTSSFPTEIFLAHHGEIIFLKKNLCQNFPQHPLYLYHTYIMISHLSLRDRIYAIEKKKQ